jgi:hypothetical protein
MTNAPSTVGLEDRKRLARLNLNPAVGSAGLESARQLQHGHGRIGMDGRKGVGGRLSHGRQTKGDRDRENTQ